MGKAGEKQKRRPKLKDKKQSEWFKEAARQLGAEEGSDAFDRVVKQMARQEPKQSAFENAGIRFLDNDAGSGIGSEV